MNTEIKQYAMNILASYKELKVTWNDVDTELTIHKTNTDGFDVIVGMDEMDIYVFTDCGFDDHWRLKELKIIMRRLKVYLVLFEICCLRICKLR